MVAGGKSLFKSSFLGRWCWQLQRARMPFLGRSLAFQGLYTQAGKRKRTWWSVMWKDWESVEEREKRKRQTSWKMQGKGREGDLQNGKNEERKKWYWNIDLKIRNIFSLKSQSGFHEGCWQFRNFSFSFSPHLPLSPGASPPWHQRQCQCPLVCEWEVPFSGDVDFWCIDGGEKRPWWITETAFYTKRHPVHYRPVALILAECTVFIFPSMGPSVTHGTQRLLTNGPLYKSRMWHMARHTA